MVDPPSLLVNCHMYDSADPASRLPCGASMREEVLMVECFSRWPHATAKQVLDLV